MKHRISCHTSGLMLKKPTHPGRDPLCRPCANGNADIAIGQGATDRIRGRAKPSDRLPTEQELNEEFKVSRTVVRRRSPVSGRWPGLDPAGRQRVRAAGRVRAALPHHNANLNLLKDVIAVLGCASGSSPTQPRLPRSAASEPRGVRELDRMAAIDASGSRQRRLHFHRTIARRPATGAPRISSLSGSLLIPRARLQTFRYFAADRQYLRRVNREHEDIYQAIKRQIDSAFRHAAAFEQPRERLRLAMTDGEQA
jgi:hypothetical protein